MRKLEKAWQVKFPGGNRFSETVLTTRGAVTQIINTRGRHSPCRFAPFPPKLLFVRGGQMYCANLNVTRVDSRSLEFLWVVCTLENASFRHKNEDSSWTDNDIKPYNPCMKMVGNQTVPGLFIWLVRYCLFTICFQMHLSFFSYASSSTPHPCE